MSKLHAVDALVLTLNTCGFLGYLIWLVQGQQRIFYTQEGVLYLLPCLPFFFVYVFLHRKRHMQPERDTDHDGAQEQG